MPSDDFFFSSRRRHTISKRDWSSDVCSSDLHRGKAWKNPAKRDIVEDPAHQGEQPDRGGDKRAEPRRAPKCPRSEERRVGKECRSRWWAEEAQQKSRT